MTYSEAVYGNSDPQNPGWVEIRSMHEEPKPKQQWVTPIEDDENEEEDAR
jgi:hypothetical protein